MAAPHHTKKIILEGFTFIEMLVVISISLITMIAITAALIFFYTSDTDTLNQGYAIESAREGIQLAVKDIRAIQYGVDGSYPIASIATSSFTFYSDALNQGIPQQITYELSGTNFLRIITSATGSPPLYDSALTTTTTISSFVQNGVQNIPIFAYFNASSTQIATPATTTAVSYATITLVVNANVATTSGDYTLSSTAALRNTSQF